MEKSHNLIGIFDNCPFWDPNLFSKPLNNSIIQFFADDKSIPELEMLKDNEAAIKKSISIANKKSIIPVIHLPFSIRFDNFYRPFFRAYIDKIIEYCQMFTEQSYIVMHLWPGETAENKKLAWLNKRFPSKRRNKSSKKKKTPTVLSPADPLLSSVSSEFTGVYPILILENMINMTTPKDLKAVASMVKKTNIQFCIDTAHVWGGGIDIRTPELAEKYLKKLESKKIKIGLIHLNPPKYKFGKIIDRHGDIDTSPMKPEVMNVFVDYAVKHNIICIIEYPSLINIKTITKMWFDDQKNK